MERSTGERDGPEVIHASILGPVSGGKTHRADSATSPVVVASEATGSNAWIVDGVVADNVHDSVAQTHGGLSVPCFSGSGSFPDRAFLIGAQVEPVERVSEWCLSWAGCAAYSSTVNSPGVV